MASQIQKSPESGLSILRAWTPDGPVHGFLGRLGGVSAGPYSSLNLSYFVGDDPAAVDANWQCLRERLPRHSVSARLNQVHGNVVHEIGPVYDGSRLNGDGMV